MTNVIDVTGNQTQVVKPVTFRTKLSNHGPLGFQLQLTKLGVCFTQKGKTRQELEGRLVAAT
jgi:hypothetical protein